MVNYFSTVIISTLKYGIFTVNNAFCSEITVSRNISLENKGQSFFLWDLNQPKN